MQSGRCSSLSTGTPSCSALAGHGSSESVSPSMGRVEDTRTPAAGPRPSRTIPRMLKSPLGGGVGASASPPLSLTGGAGRALLRARRAGLGASPQE
jgi:hypothetical protein